MSQLIIFDLDGTLVRRYSEDALFVEAMKTWLNVDTVTCDRTSNEHVTDADIAPNCISVFDKDNHNRMNLIWPAILSFFSEGTIQLMLFPARSITH